jgi:uncharacterized membrane protein
MFVFWSFVGWCIEVVTMTIETGEYQNRGFLNMPICPIYGAGVILAVVLFRPIVHTWILLFFATAILCTAFELFVGIMLEKIFGNRWWDYSMYKFNFKGLICLWVSVGWGLGCLIVLKAVQPGIEELIDKIPYEGGLVFLAIMFVLIMIDLASSVRAAINLNIHLKRIDDISGVMLKSAQGIGKRLAGGTQKAMKTAETAKERAEKTAETAKERVGAVAETAKERVEVAREDIYERYEALVNTRNKAVLRLLRAFPTMRSRRYMRALRILQHRFAIKYIPTDEEKENINESTRD